MKRRGMAVVQALLIVAAIAAVSAALLIRAEAARDRLAHRLAADQAALYLDAGVAQLRALLPERGAVTLRQEWARPRDGVEIDRGTLGWRAADLQGRFNLNLLIADPDLAYQTAFRRLAAGAGLRGEAVDRVLAELVGQSDDLTPGLPLFFGTLVGAEDAEAWQTLAPQLGLWPRDEPMNVNTMSEPVLAALAPDLSGLALDTLVRRLTREPADSPEALVAWVGQRLGEPAAEALQALGLGVTSRRYVLEVEAQLDSVRLRRSVVVDTGSEDSPAAVLMSVPRP